MVTRSEHSFGPGTAESTITAKWVAQIDRTQDEEGDGSKSKCEAKVKAREAAVKSPEADLPWYKDVFDWLGGS